MLAGNTVALGNGLRISIDWLSWTLKEPCSVKDALSMMGILWLTSSCSLPGLMGIVPN